jgi:hypothetical protein
MDEQTAKLMAEKGIWLSTQPFLAGDGEGGAAQLGPAEQAKMKQVIDGTNTVYKLAKKYHPPKGLPFAKIRRLLRIPAASSSACSTRTDRRSAYRRKI